MKDKFDTKKFVLINSILIFLFGFITHNLYNWLPSFITVIFPVNESLFEHLKMIFITPVIISIIWYGYTYIKKICTFYTQWMLRCLTNLTCISTISRWKNIRR